MIDLNFKINQHLKRLSWPSLPLPPSLKLQLFGVLGVIKCFCYFYLLQLSFDPAPQIQNTNLILCLGNRQVWKHPTCVFGDLNSLEHVFSQYFR